MDTKIYLKRCNHINDRLCDIYKEAVQEIFSVAKELNIENIQFYLHENLNLDIPSLVFEEDYGDRSDYQWEKITQIVFDDDYTSANLIGDGGDCAYMDEQWGEYFNVEKIGDIYRVFMQVVGNNDIKPIETR